MKLRLSSILLIVSILPAAASAQTIVDTTGQTHLTPLEHQYYNATTSGANIWNSTILAPSERVNYSDIKVGATGVVGNFHRPQQAESSSMYNFCADGALTMSKFYFQAGFKFSEIFENDVKFNSILDPYRGTPYIIADSTGGDWKKQLYNMWVKIASPYYNDFVSVGISAGLDVGRGAKKTDPRPQANSNQINVRPSVSFRFGAHTLGGDFSYRRFMENTNLILYNAAESQKIYLMKGFGQYIYDIFSTTERERRYKGNGYGFDAQYAFRTPKTTFMLSGGYENYTEEAVDIEYDKPRKRGRLYETSYNIAANATITCSRITHTLSLRYDDIERSGREIIQVFDPSLNVNAWLTDSEAPRRSVVNSQTLDFNYGLLVRNGAQASSWRFDLSGTYNDFSDEYAVMKSFLKYKNLFTSLRAEKNVQLNERNFLQGALSAGYLWVWDRQMNLVAREEDDTRIAEDFVSKDVAYLFESCCVGQIEVMYGHNLKNKNSIYVKGIYNHTQATSNIHRSNFSLWVGYNF